MYWRARRASHRRAADIGNPSVISSLRARFHDFLSDERFSEILTGSLWAFGARVLATGLGLIVSIMTARLYGAEMVGIMAMIQAFLLMATIVTVLGTDTSILRLIPEHVAKYSVTSAYYVYKKTQYFVGGVSLLVGVFLFISSDFIAQPIFGKPQLSFYFSLAPGFIFFRSLMDLNAQAVRGLQLIKPFVFMQVVPSAIVLLALIVMTLLQTGQNSPVYAQMFAWASTAVIGAGIMAYFFRKQMRPGDAVQTMPIGKILRISTPMLMTASATFLMGQTGVVVLGIFASEADVGYYAMAVKLATLTLFVIGAINSMAAPKFSELYNKGEMDELFYVAKKSTRLIFWSTVPLLLVLVVFGGALLQLFFGAAFQVAYPAMVMLVAGQLVSCMAGSTGHFMNMTGNEKVFRNIVVVTSLLNVALSVLLIPRFGILGAAIATAVCMVIWNAATVYYIKSRYGHSIAYIPFLPA